jgi:hypothetical protein
MKKICLDDSKGDIFELYKTFGGNLNIKFKDTSINIIEYNAYYDPVTREPHNVTIKIGFEIENNKLEIWTNNENLEFGQYLYTTQLYQYSHGNGVIGPSLQSNYKGPLELELIDI